MTARGGTELVSEQLANRLPDWALKKAQIISRPQDIDYDRLQVFWAHDMPESAAFLSNETLRSAWDGIVFVSYWQQSVYALNAGVPFSAGEVIKNAIVPLPENKKPDGPIKIIYHPTPHRGLELLVPVFDELSKEYDINLEVYSSFDIYGWPEKNAAYQELFDFCREHEKINYYGSRPHDEVRAAVVDAHIFAYPSIWLETSCMAAMEAMSGRCLMVAPHWGALPETMANYNISYSWTEDVEEHKKIFARKLRQAIESVRSEQTSVLLDEQKRFADRFYNWDRRVEQWVDYIDRLEKTRRINFPSFS